MILIYIVILCMLYVTTSTKTAVKSALIHRAPLTLLCPNISRTYSTAFKGRLARRVVPCAISRETACQPNKMEICLWCFLYYSFWSIEQLMYIVNWFVFNYMRDVHLFDTISMAYGCELCSTCHVMGIFVNTTIFLLCLLSMFSFWYGYMRLELTKRIGSDRKICAWSLCSILYRSVQVLGHSGLRCVVLFALFILDLMSFNYGICKFSCIIISFFSWYCSGLLWCGVVWCCVVLFALLILDMIDS